MQSHKPTAVHDCRLDFTESCTSLIDYLDANLDLVLALKRSSTNCMFMANNNCTPSIIYEWLVLNERDIKELSRNSCIVPVV
jgi:hypothetical protein